MPTFSPPIAPADEIPTAQKAAKTIVANERITVLRICHTSCQNGFFAGLPSRMQGPLPETGPDILMPSHLERCRGRGMYPLFSPVRNNPCAV
jgi:hypothetical protein